MPPPLREAIWAAAIVGAIALAVLQETTGVTNWLVWLMSAAIGVSVVVVAHLFDPARPRGNGRLQADDDDDPTPQRSGG